MHCRERCADLVLWHVQDISIRERANIYAVGDDSDFEFTHLITIPAGILLASEWSCGLRCVIAANRRQSGSRDPGGASQNIATRDLVHEFTSKRKHLVSISYYHKGRSCDHDTRSQWCDPRSSRVDRIAFDPARPELQHIELARISQEVTATTARGRSGTLDRKIIA